MKSLTNYINEKLIVNKNYNQYIYATKSFDELRNIIVDRYIKLGPGTEQNPINFNDIDVSNLDSFYNYKKAKGIFQKINIKYIDISDWDVSNIKSMNCMFAFCDELKSVGDISKWDVSNVTDMYSMFLDCKFFNQDISKWDVSSVIDMYSMFYDCKLFNQDLSGWNVSNVTDMTQMFRECRSFNQDLSSWDVSKVKFKIYIFLNCPIKEEYKPKFK